MPHVMKRLFAIFPIVALCFMSACSDVCDQDFTPEIVPFKFYLFPIDEVTDSVRELTIISSATEMACYDTISVGDTVIGTVALNARTSVLTTFSMSYDTTALAVKVLLTDEQQLNVVADSTDVDKGLVYFKPKYGSASLQVRYVPLKTGMDTISMRVASTSKFSPNYFDFRQPVK